MFTKSDPETQFTMTIVRASVLTTTNLDKRVTLAVSLRASICQKPHIANVSLLTSGFG